MSSALRQSQCDSIAPSPVGQTTDDGAEARGKRIALVAQIPATLALSDPDQESECRCQ